MENDIWAIWGNIDFLIPTIAFIVAMIIALYFEGKYLDERKKNQRLMKYTIKPTIAPLNPMSVIQKAADGTCQSGLTPIGIMTNPSATAVHKKVRVTSIIFLRFIGYIVNRINQYRQPKTNDTSIKSVTLECMGWGAVLG